MERVIDDVARILATNMPRRRLFSLLGGVFAGAALAAFGVQPVQAQQACASNANCPPGSCCNTQNPKKKVCCVKGTCMCQNGTCSASSGGRCPASCVVATC